MERASLRLRGGSFGENGCVLLKLHEGVTGSTAISPSNRAAVWSFEAAAQWFSERHSRSFIIEHFIDAVVGNRPVSTPCKDVSAEKGI